MKTCIARCRLAGRGIAATGLRDRFGGGDRLHTAGAQGIDHHVAGEDDARGVDTLSDEVADGFALGDVEPVRELVGEQPVDFFGHRAITRAVVNQYSHLNIK